MACTCCERYAPKHYDGSALPPCAGTEAIEEARNLARLWHKRAKEMGWCPTIISARVKDTPTAVHLEGLDQHGNPVEETVVLCPDPVASKHAYRSIGPHLGPHAPLKEKMAAHLAECIVDGRELAYCQGPERHHIAVDSEGYEAFVEKGCFHCGAFPEVAP